MDWMPFLLIFVSGAFMAPMLISFQKQMEALDQKVRVCKAQLQESDASIQKFKEEEARVKAKIEEAKTELAAIDREKEEQERKFREAKRQMMTDDE